MTELPNFIDVYTSQERNMKITRTPIHIHSAEGTRSNYRGDTPDEHRQFDENVRALFKLWQENS